MLPAKAQITRNNMEQPPKKMTRAWCYTINNYSEEDIRRLQEVDAVRHVCGREVGENGTPHLQGYVRFQKPQRFSWWKNQFPRAHVEPRIGSEKQASDYCKKEGDIIIDKGHDVDTNRKYSTVNDEIDDVIAEIEDGEKYGQIRNRHKRFFFRYKRNVIEYMYDEKRLKANPDYDPTDYMNRTNIIPL